MKTICLITFLSMCFFAYTQTSKEHWIECNNEGCLINDPYYTDSTTVNWTGKCSNGKATGYGILTKYDSGKLESTYLGHYKKGIRQGKGRFVHHIDGTEHIGYFKDGQMVGKGTCTDSLGNHYKGNFINYRMHGNGTLLLVDGSVFKGFMVSDKRYSGKMIHSDGSLSYIQNYQSADSIIEIKSKYKPQIRKHVTEYFDDKWRHCEKQYASFYRIVTYKAPHTPQGTIKHYTISGDLIEEINAAYISYDDQAKNFYEGEFWRYYPDQTVRESGCFLNNSLDGPQMLFYNSGKISDICHYKNGVNHGESITWDENGCKTITSKYESGNLVDDQFLKYRNDTICSWIYIEDFNKYSNEWAYWNYKDETTITDDNKLRFSVADSLFTPHVREKYIDINPNHEFEIYLQISRISGVDSSACGISFGSNGYNTFYHFCINNKREYFIIASIDGVFTPLTAITFSQAIKLGKEDNVLTIRRFNDVYFFWINEHLIEELPHLQLNEQNIGVVSYFEGEHVINYLITNELNPNCDY